MPCNADAQADENSIRHLYRASSGEATWEHALDLVMQRIGGLGCQMIGINRANGAINFSFTSAYLSGDYELEYIRHYHSSDPRIPLLLERPVGDWLIDQDEFSAEVFANHHYYSQYLNAANGGFSATARLYEDKYQIVLFAAVMRHEGGKFSEQQRAYLARLAPHLVEAVALYRKNRQRATGDFAGRQMIERIGRPVVVVDEGRCITMANRAAAEMMDQGQVMHERAGCLAPVNSADELALTCAIAELRNTLKLSGSGARSVLRLMSQAQGPVAASLIAFDPASSMHVFGVQPQMMISIHGILSSPEPDLYLWQATFDLTPAEARMAAMILRGNTLTGASLEWGISHHTANKHLDNVFMKTNTHRQPDLVRVLMQTLD